MAFWYRKGSRVYVYHRLRGKQEQVPRSEYRQLDEAPDTEIDAWVLDWTIRHGGTHGPERIPLGDDPLGRLLRRYRAYLAGLEERGDLDPATVDRQWSLVQNYIVPYFVARHGLKDPVAWQTVSFDFFPWIWAARPNGAGASPSTARDAGLALRNLWRWLQRGARVVPVGAGLPLETIRGLDNRETPLTRTLGPGTVLRFLQQETDPRTRLLVILGYFFSLRPQEIFAVRRGDFVAGPAARAELAAKAMAAAGRYTDLVVYIERQRPPRRRPTQRIDVKNPKAHSYGWVACFSRQAAWWLVTLLNGMPPDRPDATLLPGDVRAIYREWETAREGTTLAPFSLKDLRRASLHWLGHGPMAGAPIALMKHARHKDLETTMLYIRSPRQKGPRTTGQFRLDPDDDGGKGVDR